jgi:hypothetical protein
MTISDHLTHFSGLPVFNHTDQQTLKTSPASVAHRLAIDWDAHESGTTMEEVLAEFVAQDWCPEVEALIIGDWGGTGQGDDSEPVVEALVSSRERLKSLKALFLGEMTGEESEISWINQTDVSPILEAYPQLEVFYIRGGEGLSLGRPRHQKLRELEIQTGGLPSNVVQEITQADLPSLERLVLWLGDDGYGNDVTTDDLRNLVTSGPVQNLRYLGLMDDCRADETAKLLAEIGIPKSVETLDLSLGVLGDEGARALANSNWITSLKKLDISHHYVSPEVVEQLKTLVPEVDDSECCEPHVYNNEENRYVAVSE